MRAVKNARKHRMAIDQKDGLCKTFRFRAIFNISKTA